MKAVAPIQAVDTRTMWSWSTGTNEPRKATTVKLPSSPHRPRTDVIKPPSLVASKNQPKTNPPAADTQYFEKLKKKIPAAAPKKEEITQARRYSPRIVVDGYRGDGGCIAGSTLIIRSFLIVCGECSYPKRRIRTRVKSMNE